FQISDSEARKRRTLELARDEPGSVAESLLEAADLLLETDPDRANELAGLAASVVESMDPKEHPSADRMNLFARAHLLMGESRYRLHERAEEAMDQAERQFAQVSGLGLYPYSIRSIRRRRELERRREDFDA